MTEEHQAIVRKWLEERKLDEVAPANFSTFGGTKKAYGR